MYIVYRPGQVEILHLEASVVLATTLHASCAYTMGYLAASWAEALLRCRQHIWSSLCPQESLICHWRRISSDHTADTHEEAISPVSIRPSSFSSGITNPNVAPEPAMYCPSVRMIPFGPAPYLKMLTVPVERSLSITCSGA
jgi:hypothetical protein